MILLITTTVFSSPSLSSYLYNEAHNNRLQDGPDIMTDVAELADDYQRPEKTLGTLGFVHQPWENIRAARLTFKIGSTEFAIYEVTRVTVDEATELANVEACRRNGTIQQKKDAKDIFGGLDIAGFTNHFASAMGIIAERLSYDHDIQMNGKTLIQYQVYDRDTVNLTLKYFEEFGMAKVLEQMPIMAIESFPSNSDLDDMFGEEEEEDEFIPYDPDDDGETLDIDDDVIIDWDAEMEAAAAYDEE